MSLLRTMFELRRFAQTMSPSLPPVDLALPRLRALLLAAALPYRLVGGIAVVHHGYERSTRDLDVLVPAGAEVAIDPLLEAHGFMRQSRTRLLHAASGVSIDLLIAGDPMPRPGQPSYPEPVDVLASPRDPGVIGLAGLVVLKLRAGRLQDRADVAALLKRLSEGEYLDLEAGIEPTLRPGLMRLRDEALQELVWES